MAPRGYRRQQQIALRVGMWLCLLLAILLVLFPIYWMVITSLKLPRDIFRVPSLWPPTLTLLNYDRLMDDGIFITSLENSLIVAMTVTVISVFVAAMAAYSLVRFRYHLRSVIGRLILLAYLTPASLLFIPLSVLISRLHLNDSLLGLVVAYLTFSLPLSTWLLQGYLRGVPKELEEQAMIDGLSRFGALLRVVLPLSAPGLAAVSIFVFSGAWNELLLALVLMGSESHFTMPVALNYMISSDTLPWGPLMAGAVVSSIPLMVLYFAAQRFIVAGLTQGAVKG
jgi:multiple sugar transport system permease protein